MLEKPVVVVDVVAFDLVGGGGRAPQKACWELDSFASVFDILQLFGRRLTREVKALHKANIGGRTAYQ